MTVADVPGPIRWQKAAWACAGDFAGADLSRPIAVPRTFPRARGPPAPSLPALDATVAVPELLHCITVISLGLGCPRRALQSLAMRRDLKDEQAVAQSKGGNIQEGRENYRVIVLYSAK